MQKWTYLDRNELTWVHSLIFQPISLLLFLFFFFLPLSLHWLVIGRLDKCVKRDSIFTLSSSSLFLLSWSLSLRRSQDFHQEATSKCWVEFSTSMVSLLSYGSKNSQEFCFVDWFWVLGSKGGLTWGIQLGFKLDKGILADWFPNKASILNYIDFKC